MSDEQRREAHREYLAMLKQERDENARRWAAMSPAERARWPEPRITHA